MQNRQLIERFKRAAGKIERFVSPPKTTTIDYGLPAPNGALSTALPKLSTSKVAENLLDLVQSSFGTDGILKSLKRRGIDVSNPDAVRHHLIDFFESPEKALTAFAQLTAMKETDTKFAMLHAAAMHFPGDKKLWESLAGALAAGNRPADAARTYAYQALHLPRSFYNSWNASTLSLQIGDLKEALYFWSHAEADTSTEPRAIAFKPIIAAVRGAPGAQLADDWDAAAAISDQIPDWIFRRWETCAETFATAPIVKYGSESQRARVEQALEKIGMKSAWDNGWAHVAPADVHDTDSLMKIAATAARLGNRDTAIAIVNGFEADAEVTPSDWLNVAKGYIHLGLFDDTLKAIHHIDCTPEDFAALVAEIPKERTDKRVLPLLREILGRVPGDVRVARRAGEIAMEAGAIDIAQNAFATVLETSPDDVDIQYKSAVCLLMQNHSIDAGEILDRVIGAVPDHAEAHLLRSHLHFQKCDYPSAINDLLIAERGVGDLATCRYHLSIAYRANRNHLEASQSARRLLDTPDLTTEQINRGRILYLTESALSGDADARNDVIDFVTDAIDNHPNFGESLLFLVFAFNLGEYDLAHKSLQHLKGIAPKSELVGFWDVYLGYHLDSPDLARNIKPRRTHTLEGRLHAIASAAYHVRHGAYEDAKSMLAPIVTTDPTFARGAYIMAQSMLETGKPQDALAYLSRLVGVGDVRKDLKQLIRDAKNCGANARGQKLAITADAKKSYGVWQDLDHPFGPLVTIGVPSYNETRFLSDALNSVWLQSLPFWQCMSVDDCSSDETAALAKDYAQLDRRFAAVTHVENGGLSAARNTALKAANTQYVTFLDGDDYYSLNSLWRRTDRLLAEQSNDECAGSYGGIRVSPEFSFGDFPLTEQKTPRKKVTFATVGYEAPFNAHAPLLRTDVMRRVEGFDESMREGAEDWDCWTRILRAGYYFSPTQILCGKYRQKRGSMARSLAPQHVEAAKKIYDQIMSPAPSNTSPVVFHQGFPSLNASRHFSDRALRFAAMSQIAGDGDGAVRILSRIPLSLDHMDRIGISIENNVRAGSARFYSDALNTIDGISRKEFIDRQIDEISEQFRDFLDTRTDVAALTDAAPDTGFATAAPAQGTIGTRAPVYIKLEERDHRLASIEKLRAMRNKHAGERCFIIGNGPSLNDLDLTKIGSEPAIGVNGIFYKCDDIDWWPRYYTVEDSSVMNENLERIIAFPAEQKFFPVNYTELHPNDENVNFFIMNRGFYEAKSPNFGVPRFSTDFAERAYTGQTVTYINLQLAFHLGFTEVYLIGMDFSYVIPKEFEKKGDMIVSTDDDPNHFHPDYFGKGKSWKDPKLEMVLLNYRMAKLAYEAAGRKIYNATAGGQLELFERKDFNSLF